MSDRVAENMVSPSRHELLAEVVSLYYNEDRDQKQIAEQIGLSRSTVSRMISEARELGIVEIRINAPLPTDETLQAAAEARYGIQLALILNASSIHGSVGQRVGGLAARHLSSLMGDDTSVAISWGSSLAAVAEALPFEPHPGARVVQMIGAIGSRQPTIDGAELARNMASKFAGSYMSLNAPLVVDDPEVAAALLRQASLSSVLDAAAQSTIALTGLGSTDPEVSSLLRAGFATPTELDEAASVGIVGDVAGHMLNRTGEVVSTDLSRRMLHLDEARLRAIPTVIAVASGSTKISIIHAALCSGLINVIVTDSDTMTRVLRYAESLDATA